MKLVIAAFLSLMAGGAYAEPTEITPLKDSELPAAGCPKAGFIVRCENGVAVYCEKPRTAMHYSCVDGAPVRAPPASAVPTPSGATPPASVAPHARRETRQPRRYHRPRARTLLDLIFRTRH